MNELIAALMRYGLENVAKRYYGNYRGVVVDTRDPEERGRVRVKVPYVSAEDPPDDYWFEPAVWGAGGGRGSFWPPEIGDSVRVTFDQGDLAQPGVYFGGWYGSPGGKTEVPSALGYSGGLPEKRGFVTRGGHMLVLDDTAGEESIRLVWHKVGDDDPAKNDRTKAADISKGKLGVLSFLKDGGFAVSTASGDRFHMDPATATVKIMHATPDRKVSGLFLDDKGWKLVAPDGTYLAAENGEITLNGKNFASLVKGSINLSGNVFLGGKTALSGVPLGDALVAWLASHVHTSAPPGSPTSPPVTASALQALISKVIKARLVYRGIVASRCLTLLLPKLAIPGLPGLPSLPTLRLPTLPSLNLDIPGLELPTLALPALNLPDLPGLPDIPQIKLPTLPSLAFACPLDLL